MRRRCDTHESSKIMLAAVKIGNSTIQICFFNNPLSSYFSSIASIDIKKELDIEGKIEKIFFPFSDNYDSVVCSVVPDLTKKALKFIKSRKTIVINYETFTGLKLKVKNPEKFGPDRIASAVAAYTLLKKNVAIVDFGTATTITVVTEKGEIIGGAIMPGINMMKESLSEKTALLPYIDLNLNNQFSALGDETHSAIRSGIVWGTVYAVKGIISQIEKETSLKLTTVLTGGWSDFLSKYFHKKFKLNPYLVFEGMRLIYLNNIYS